jgi:hypothetical protein
MTRDGRCGGGGAAGLRCGGDFGRYRGSPGIVWWGFGLGLL